MILLSSSKRTTQMSISDQGNQQSFGVFWRKKTCVLTLDVACESGLKEKELKKVLMREKFFLEQYVWVTD